MRGIVYRFGMRLKDAGERAGWAWLIRLGLKIREAA